MTMHRREFLQATVAASVLLAGSGAGTLGRLAAQQRLTQDDLLQFDPLGSVTLLVTPEGKTSQRTRMMRFTAAFVALIVLQAVWVAWIALHPQLG